MSYYERLKRKKLGDVLVDEEASTKEAVITAMHEHHQSARPLSQILIAGNELREYDLARVMVEQYQLPFLDLVNYSYHRDLIASFPARLLHDARVVPLDRFGDVVCFVVQEFPSEEVFAELEEYGAKRVFLYAALAAEIRQALHDHVPLEDEELVPEPDSGPGAQPATPALGEDGAWKELFDTANESIVSTLDSDSGVEPIPEDDPASELGGEPDGDGADEDETAKDPAKDEIPSWLSEEG